MNSFIANLLLCFFAVFVALLFGLFAVFILYLHYIHTINAHLPSPPRSSFILGHLPDIAKWRTNRQKNRQESLTSHYFQENRQKYGPIYVLFFIHRAVVVIGDPEYVKQVYVNHKVVSKSKLNVSLGFPFATRFFGSNSIVTALGYDSWHKKRQVMNPAFHRKSLKNFMTDFNNVCDRFVARITNVVEQKQEARMASEFSKAALEIIAQVSFNINIGAIEDPNTPFLKAITSALRMTEASAKNPLLLIHPSLLSIYKYWPFRTELIKKQIDEVKFLRKFTSECVTRRINDIQANKDTPDDLLSMLINDKLSVENIIDEFLTVFVAGHETTANSLAFTLYEIAQNPDIEEKILVEVKEVLGEKEYVEYEDLPKLKYLGQVLQESLRKYPVIQGLSKRILEKEITVGGYKLRKGVRVMAPRYAFNFNPEYWENPDVFDPERFSAPENIPNFSTLYFPFHVGARNCIGQNFAKFESKVILARILRKFRFQLLPGQTAAGEARVALAPRDGVMCKVAIR